jgi:hypothetical protein
MARLEALPLDASAWGILPHARITVFSYRWHGRDARELLICHLIWLHPLVP